MIQKQLSLTVVTLALLSMCGPKKQEASQSNTDTQPVPEDNTLTLEEQEAGWQLLFDGKTSTGWRGYKKDSFPQGWQIIDGMLHFPGLTEEQKQQGFGGDIITTGRYENFEFQLDWKIAEGGNSGIFYLGQEMDHHQAIYESALEMQVLSDSHPDAKLGTNGNRRAGSLYDMIPANPQNVKPAGDWNTVKIVKQGAKVEHWQNGQVVVSYELWSDKWKELVANSKWKDFPDMAAPVKEGHFGLQDHGDKVWFKNIKIRPL